MKDGGPAFPHGPLGMSFTGEDGYTSHQCPASEGMSLRDYFAGQAASGLLADPNLYNGPNWPSLSAGDCYKFADAMLAEREKS